MNMQKFTKVPQAPRSLWDFGGIDTPPPLPVKFPYEYTTGKHRPGPMFFPPDLREWLPENHLAYFIVDIIERLDLQRFKLNRRGSGDEQYPPAMMLELLVYCYIIGIFSSRRIQQATYTDVAV
ncbi:MAG: hypothetical protein LBQ88_11570, partial [Treponema sp.]|nr:hypothetical protein [Treponema sp.]